MRNNWETLYKGHIKRETASPDNVRLLANNLSGTENCILGDGCLESKDPNYSFYYDPYHSVLEIKKLKN